MPDNPAIPVLTLAADTFEMTVGQPFDVVSQVADITDDKDCLLYTSATAQNGNNWGLVKYGRQCGWIALTQVSVVANNDSETEKGIVFERFMENDMEYAAVTSYDEEGNVLWIYKTCLLYTSRCV